MEYVVSILIGILLGSIPTAYIILKKFKKIDITSDGSGNVGAMNSLRLSRSKYLAAVVLIIDLAKGFFTVLFISLLFGENFSLKVIGLISAVLSHSFSFWIKFKGGRGLATTAGGAILISIPLLLIWLVMWAIAFAFRRSIHFSSFTSSLLTAGLSFTSADVLNKYSNPPAESNLEFSILISTLLVIILIRHIEPIKNYIKQQAEKSRKV
ncbi:MAG: glycerol-3-phosphate acyltransferase [Melioribacteraceae bacterium]|nr:glycerol-3-phosphate acyltransferase [Melioribacteraceae bacterium]